MCTGSVISYTCGHDKPFCFRICHSKCGAPNGKVSVDTMCEPCTMNQRNDIFWRWAIARARLERYYTRRRAEGLPTTGLGLSEKFKVIDELMVMERRACGLIGPMFMTEEEKEVLESKFQDTMRTVSAADDQRFPFL